MTEASECDQVQQQAAATTMTRQKISDKEKECWTWLYTKKIVGCKELIVISVIVINDV